MLQSFLLCSHLECTQYYLLVLVCHDEEEMGVKRMIRGPPWWAMYRACTLPHTIQTWQHTCGCACVCEHETLAIQLTHHNSTSQGHREWRMVHETRNTNKEQVQSSCALYPSSHTHSIHGITRVQRGRDPTKTKLVRYYKLQHRSSQYQQVPVASVQG